MSSATRISTRTQRIRRQGDIQFSRLNWLYSARFRTGGLSVRIEKPGF